MGWVCLMYHDILPEVGTRGGGPERFTVTSSNFEAMLETIASEGYHGCTLTEALDEPAGSRVAITFDDGNAGQFEHGARLLAKHGMTATFFVTTDWVGTPGFVSWDGLRSWKAAGMSIQSHTKSHPHLSTVSRAELDEELVASKAALDDRLEQETRVLALPGGDRPRRAWYPAFASAGYSVVATSRWGRNAEPVRPGEPRGWVYRCTAPTSGDPDLNRRIVNGDAGLAWRNASREAVLNGARSFLGADRYRRWRRRALDLVRTTSSVPAS